MRRALVLAARGAGQVAPNPLVGAVVVQDGTIVGEGWHAEYGRDHAEVVALNIAGERARGATLYVTLEPCNHTGKTPPCTDAILRAGISRVVYAAADPNPRAAGGAERLRAAGVRVHHGVLEQQASELNAPFLFAARGATRPWVTLKLAVSLDGAIADHTRRPGWISGSAAQKAVHRLRASADAIAVGIGTALADDPALTVRFGPAPRVAPRRVVFDRRAELPVTSMLVRSAAQVPVIVVTESAPVSHDASARAAALAAAGVTVIRADSVSAALAALKQHGVNHLLVEGGAGLASALVDANLVDRLIMIQGSVILGQNALPAFAALPPRTVSEAQRWRVVSRRAFEDDCMTTYAVSEL
jgi:diaminohydroxyphosphoribosylaminopyrimidine deaminase/5-amino-6-(5-phosphoribosylamino)uracil reductase